MIRTALLGAFAARSARESFFFDKLDRLGQSETTISQILHKGPTKKNTGSDLEIQTERRRSARRNPFRFRRFRRRKNP